MKFRFYIEILNLTVTGYCHLNMYDKYSLEAAVKNSDWVLRYEDNSDNVSIYLDKITSKKQCFTVRLDQDSNVIVENEQKRSVEVYDYYNTEVRRSIMV